MADGDNTNAIASEHPLAPWPNVDRYPTVIGSQLTTAFISAVYKGCTYGYRREYVDVLNELLERDPSTYGAIAQRVFVVSGARVELTPPEWTKGTKYETEAQEICTETASIFEAIPRRGSAFADMQWAIYYGATASEIMWEQRDGLWTVSELLPIHSRRIGYPDTSNWEPHIWDQGAMSFIQDAFGLGTQGMFGFPLSRYPHKFIYHTPRLRGDYPTRDGLGREIAFWMALKGMAFRGGGQYIERFAKPWVLGKYKTAPSGSSEPRTANDADILILKQTAAAIAAGTLSSSVLPDSVEAGMQGPALGTGANAKLQHVEFIEFIDRQIAMAVQGQSDTMQAGANGSRAATEVRKEGSKELYRYDGVVFAEDIRASLIRSIVSLNRPGREHLTPLVTCHVSDKPDPLTRVEVVSKAVMIGLPADADALGEELGIKLVPNEGTTPRVLVPLEPVESQYEKRASGKAVPPLAPPTTDPIQPPPPNDAEPPKDSPEAEQEDDTP